MSTVNYLFFGQLMLSWNVVCNWAGVDDFNLEIMDTIFGDLRSAHARVECALGLPC